MTGGSLAEIEIWAVTKIQEDRTKIVATRILVRHRTPGLIVQTLGRVEVETKGLIVARKAGKIIAIIIIKIGDQIKI